MLIIILSVLAVYMKGEFTTSCVFHKNVRTADSIFYLHTNLSDSLGAHVLSAGSTPSKKE